MVNPMPTSHWGFESYSFLASHWRRFIVLGLKFIILFASLLLDSHRIFSSLFHFHTHSSWTHHNLYASQSPMLYNNWLPHWTKPWQSNLGHNYPQEKRPENHNSTLLLMRHTGILYIVGTGSCVGKQLEDSGILRTCWLLVVPSKRMAYNVWPKVCLLIFHISEHGRTAFCAFRVERGNERNYLLATSVVRHMGILTQPPAFDPFATQSVAQTSSQGQHEATANRKVGTVKSVWMYPEHPATCKVLLKILVIAACLVCIFGRCRLKWWGADPGFTRGAAFLTRCFGRINLFNRLAATIDTCWCHIVTLCLEILTSWRAMLTACIWCLSNGMTVRDKVSAW